MKASWTMSSARAWSETMPRTYATIAGGSAGYSVSNASSLPSRTAATS